MRWLVIFIVFKLSKIRMALPGKIMECAEAQNHKNMALCTFTQLWIRYFLKGHGEILCRTVEISVENRKFAEFN